VGNIELVKSITEMSQAAENIESITDIIEDISFQTNLLSLNASVEAARAGEQGKGFGVVAGSIRELSGKTSESAKEISELISEAIKKSKNGSVLAKENSDTINKILNNISKSLKTVKEVNENLEGQSKSLDPLSEGITQMSNIAKVSTTKAIACNKISKDLAKATVDMDQIISSLGNILKGGD
jgi:methyl-accepting chemotaxis protein